MISVSCMLEYMQMSSHHHIGNIKFPSHTNGIQWILALPGTRTLVKLQQKQWFLLAFCKAATAAVIPPRLFNAMHDQRLNTGSCCYAETSEIKNVMQLRPYAHQDGIEHVCVVVCLPFSLDVGWRFDSLIRFMRFRWVCYFSTVKEQCRRDSNPTYELFMPTSLLFQF